MPETTCLSLLQLLQFADSALPIGSLSHSLGLEALVFDGDVDARSFAWYLEDCLAGALFVDAVFCREAHARGLARLQVEDLNQQASALRLARESREASLAMGRRFAGLAAALSPDAALSDLASLEELHHSVAFGYVLGSLRIEEDLTVSAFLHQCVLNSISAAQRLLPLGQAQANHIAWDLKAAILEAMERSRGVTFETVGAFAHLPETASMRHPCLPTRLFIS